MRYELRERNTDLRLQVYELEKRSQLISQSLQVRSSVRLCHTLRERSQYFFFSHRFFYLFCIIHIRVSSRSKTRTLFNFSLLFFFVLCLSVYIHICPCKYLCTLQNCLLLYTFFSCNYVCKYKRTSIIRARLYGAESFGVQIMLLAGCICMYSPDYVCLASFI